MNVFYPNKISVVVGILRIELNSQEYRQHAFHIRFISGCIYRKIKRISLQKSH